MSSDDDSTDDVYLGTKQGSMRTNGMGDTIYTSPGGVGISSMTTAPDDRTSLGMYSQFQQPTVWEAVNYPQETQFTFDSFYLRYSRQAEAKAIIDKPVNDTWQDMPTVHDAKYAEQDQAVSDFEQRVQEFFAGKHTRRKPIHRLNVLDRLARLGHYSVLLIGFTDGRDIDTPVAGVSEQASIDDAQGFYASDPSISMPTDMGSPEFDGLDDVMYLSVFGEDRIEDFDVDEDMTSPRFRLPSIFRIITSEHEEGEYDNDYNVENVHWTRVLHVPEGTLEDDLRGIPALKPVFHELLNIDKIKAASGEGYWRAGYTGMHIRPPRDQQGRFMEFENDGDDVKEEIDNFIKNFDRTLSTQAEIDTLDNSVGSPVPHLEANYQSIAAATDIPKSILTGEDRADTASADDFTQYKSYIAQRRNNYAGPAIVEPLLQRMIDTGVLPEPEGDGFEISWPPLDELTPMQEWEKKEAIASALETLAPGGDTSIIASVGELRQAIGFQPEIGSEVSDPVETEAEAAEDGQSESTAFAYPEELFESEEAARERAVELGLETVHPRRFSDGLYFAPGEDLDALEEAVADMTANLSPMEMDVEQGPGESIK